MLVTYLKLASIILNQAAIVKPCHEKEFADGKKQGKYDANRISNFTPAMFTPTYWHDKQAIIGTATGRGTTYFVKYNKQQWVLRHYYRGGLIGKINKDSYLFTGVNNTRAAKEFALLSMLIEKKLPAPRPIAFNVQHNGLTYSADILTERIPDASDLVDMLQKAPLPEDTWYRIGACIKQFHHHGVFHHDLNAHNILIDQQEKVWLIDFDQGELRAPANTWQQANMARLLRSFRKEKQKLADFHWQEQDWAVLLEGYLAG